MKINVTKTEKVTEQVDITLPTYGAYELGYGGCNIIKYDGEKATRISYQPASYSDCGSPIPESWEIEIEHATAYQKQNPDPSWVGVEEKYKSSEIEFNDALQKFKEFLGKIS